MNSSSIKLSIIIPCYNCEKTLREAVESCYKQGFENESDFEIVMVDDGSTDNTKELMHTLASEHNNIQTFFNEKNQGGGATRNKAVTHSLGEVIFGLDSDDMLPPGTLLKMYTFLKETAKKSVCDGVTIHRSIKFNGNSIHNIDHVDVSPYPGERIPFTSLVSKTKEFCPVSVTFMYTKDAFTKAGGYPTSHGYDTQGFGWRFLCAGLSAYTCPDAEYLHRIHASESYYLREYNSGKMNYNWRDILLEHQYVFSDKAQSFIRTFNYKDFTRNIMDDLINIDGFLVPNIEEVLSKVSTINKTNSRAKDEVQSTPVYVRRNSMYGYYLRIKNRIRYEWNEILNEKRMHLYIKSIFKKLPISDNSKKRLRRILSPAWIYFIKHSTTPLSTIYGFDRGKPVDRFYIENFLKNNQDHIQGTCLELLNNEYTLTYGKGKITQSEILDIDTTNAQATIIDDLRKLEKIADNTYDCLILTQVFQFIDDLDAAISECYRILKDNGVLLATLPSVSRIDRMSGVDGDFWRFTKAGAEYLFQKQFKREKLEIRTQGNARSGIYFYAGLSEEETNKKVLAQNDPDFPLIVTVKATK